LLRRTNPFIWAAAFAAALAGCSHQTAAVLDPAKAQQAYVVGQRLAAKDREQQAEHRAEMARLISAGVLQTHEANRSISLLIQLQNKTAKPIASIDSGLFVYNMSGHRIGMTEIHLSKRIASRERTAFWYPLRYVRFGEDAGTMVLSSGKPKHVLMDVTEVKYADGSDAGYDD